MLRSYVYGGAPQNFSSMFLVKYEVSFKCHIVDACLALKIYFSV